MMSELEINTDTENNRMHVVIGQWDFSTNYAQHGAVLFVSILENTDHPVTLHIFHNEEIGLKNHDGYIANKNRYSEIANSYGATIEYHTITLPEWVNTDKRQRFQTLTPGALFRLYIPTILHNIERVIYLDCDMVVTTDLSKLWNMLMNDYAIAACRDAASARFVFKKYIISYTKLGIKKENYFNSGLLLMNLERIRELDCLPEKGLEFLYEHSDDVECLDQDALNFLFKDDVYYLEPKYNVYARALSSSYSQEYLRELDSNDYKDCCLHYYGTDKPWKVYLGKIDLPYWYYLSLTPWGNPYNQYIYIMSQVFPENADDAVYNKYPRILRTYGVKKALWKMFIPILVLLSYYWKTSWQLLLKR